MKTPVPVFLDSSRVVGLDRVDDLRSLGHLDGKLAFAAAQSVRAADLIEAAGLHQVDVAQFASDGLLRSSLCIFSIVGLGRHSTEFRDLIFASAPAKLFQLRGERLLSAKPSECVVEWKLGIASGFELDFTLDWKSTKFPYKSSEILQ